MALAYLRENTHATQQKLAKTLMLDANNCVILLNGLEEKGLIGRTRDPEDHRRHIVAITPKGDRRWKRRSAGSRPSKTTSSATSTRTSENSSVSS